MFRSPFILYIKNVSNVLDYITINGGFSVSDSCIEATYPKKGNSEILFFIILFLLLFYDPRPLFGFKEIPGYNLRKNDSSILFFILLFLILFYR